MKKISKISIIIMVFLMCGTFCVWAGEVTGLTTFSSGTPAVASEVNDNFTAVKTAVDDNDAAITSNYNEIIKNASDIDDLAAQPGVAWKQGGSGGTIGTSTASLQSLLINAPADGYAIVTACGSVYWNITSAGQGLVRLKVSETSGDTTEGDGVQFIRFQSGLGTGIYFFPFSTTRVFSVSKGLNTFYLNGWHQVVNGAASVDDFNFSAIFVPTSYNYIFKPIPIVIP
ncbi:MAG: hypothetical protein HGJ92_02245 [Desulfobacteraceae bacterium]|nr:hypothetical protein [Desulfobacteraceae bacterium]